MACKNGKCSRSNGSVQVTSLKSPGFFKGANPQFIQSSTLTPEQQSLQGNLIQRALSQLQNISPSAQNFSGFEPFEQMAKQNFYSDTLPTLAERFTALSPGAQNSSSYQSAVLGAGKDFDLGLAALRSQYGQQQYNNQLSLLSTLLGGSLGRSFENNFMPRQPGFLESLFTSVAPSLPILGASYLMSRPSLTDQPK